MPGGVPAPAPTALVLHWRLPAGPAPAWVRSCQALLQTNGHFRLAGESAAARPAAPPGPSAWTVCIGAPPPSDDPVANLWWISDGDGCPLHPQRPLVHSITARRGLALRLWQRRQHQWVCVRHVHLAASPRYGLGVQHLARAAAQLLDQASVDLALGVVGALANAPVPQSSDSSGPVWLALLRGRWRHWLGRQRSRWLRERWRLGVIDAPAHQVLNLPGPPVVRWLEESAGWGYWADPASSGSDGQLYCEYFDECSGVGHIERLTLDEQDRVVDRTPLPLGDGSHVSFPLVLQIDGRRVGLIENSVRRECVLFEIDDLGHWHPISTLLSGVAAGDPALFVWEGRYWLAYSDADLGVMDNLCLQYADKLEGPWQPHANNPVKMDISSARMAGGFFWHDGVLHRPAQNCLLTYGASVVMHRVVRCTPNEYVEETLGHLVPDPTGPCRDGLHTFSAWGQRTLIDGKEHTLSLRVAGHKLWRRLRGKRALAPRSLARTP